MIHKKDETKGMLYCRWALRQTNQN